MSEDIARGDVLAQLMDIQNMQLRALVPLQNLPRTSVGDAIEGLPHGVRYDA